MFLSSLLALAVLNVARAQKTTSTASIYPLVQGEGLEGQVIGTGTDGTTFRLVGTFEASTFAIPFTATLVQDSTHVSEVAVLETSDVSLVIQAECALSNQEAACVQTLIEPSATSALTLTGAVSFTGVPIVDASATLSVGASASATGSESLLPPVLSSSSSAATATSGSSAATLATGTSASTGTSTATSAARANFAFAAGSGTSVLFVAMLLSLFLPAASMFYSS